MRKDVGWKSFFEDNRRYADVINGIGCGGKQFGKHVFDFIRCAESKEKLYELVNSDSYYKEMDEETYEVVALYANVTELVGKEEYNGKDGKRDMCQAIKDLMADSREEGIKEGIVEGIEKTKLENARNLLGLLSDEIIVEKIGLPLETVKALHA